MSKFLKQRLQRLADTDLKRQMMSGIFWSFTGNLIAKVLLLLASIVLARILGQENYGKIGFIRSTLNMFATFGGLGLGITATKYVASLAKEDKSMIGSILGFSNILTALTAILFLLLIYFFSDTISFQILDTSSLVRETKITSFIVAILILNGYLVGILQGFQAFRELAHANLFAGIASFIFQIILAYKWGISGAIIGLGIGYVVICGYLVFFSYKLLEKKQIQISYDQFKVSFSIFLKYSLPAALGSLLVTPVFWFCNMVLIKGENGYSEMAIFDACNTWRLSVLFIPMAISQIVLPMLVQQKDNSKVYKKVILYNVYVNAIVAFIVAFFITIFSKWIMRSYGIEFEKGYLTLIILCFSNVLVAVNNVIGQILASKNRMWLGFAMNAFWGLVLVIFTCIMVPKIGSLGLAYAILVSYTLHSFVQLVVVKRIL